MSREAALKDYVEVNQRIIKFYEKYPTGRILTEILSWEGERVVMKATAYRDETDTIGATGHAYEKEGSSFINKTSALENCETSAVGRALALLGFEVKKSVASYEEVANARLNQNTEEKSDKDKNTTITEAMAKRIYAIGYNKGYEPSKIQEMVKQKYHCFVKNLTVEQYEYIISKLEEK